MAGVEIAAISLAVVEQILKLGFLTTEIVHTAKDFSQDSSWLYVSTRNELVRTRQLKELLNTPISGLNVHDTPFSRFDAEIQSEILGLFEQLEGIMTDVYRLVWGRYGDGAGASPCDNHGDGPSAVQRIGTPDSMASSRPPRLERASSGTTLAKMRWIWRDKKRAEQLLTQFNEMNASIYSHIKLLLLSSTLSRDLEYCRVLERDGNAKALGLDSDVRLRIIAAGERPTAGPYPQQQQQQQQQASSLEIQPWTITFPDDSCAHDSGVSICKHGADDVALEYKSIPAGKDIQETVVARARQLAALLSQHKDPSFRVLQCRGYAHLASMKRFAFLFNLPPGCHPQSVSLLDELRNRKSRPSLGDKFRLALVLASSIAQLQMVQWVHKSFRSAKVVFFRPTEGGAIAYDQPFIFGFEYSRPENDFTAGVQADDIENDIYRHPDRQGVPSRPFSKMHDIYALGVVLLEIGLWQPAIELEQNRFTTVTDPHGIQRQLLKQAARRLKDKVGDKYATIVTRCLLGDFVVAHDTKDDLKLQRLFREQVVAVLAKAAGCV